MEAAGWTLFFSIFTPHARQRAPYWKFVTAI
jgi:hypothetical protein